MALRQYDLFGNLHDKVKRAVEIAQSFCPPEGYYLAYSGGKDSTVVKAVLDMAGVKYDAHYNVTTVDPPELVRFIIGQFDAVIYDMPDGTQKYYKVKPQGTKLLFRVNKSDIEGGRTIHFTIPKIPMRRLIVKNGFPPTQNARYCCATLKEVSGEGRIVVTGVRWAESVNRKKNSGVAVVWDSRKMNAMDVADENGARFKSTERGSVIMNYDDDAARRTVEMCYRTNKTLVNPIIDFDEEDVWDFIRENNIPYCQLYDEGFKRIGCVGCPMGRQKNMLRQFERWPQYKKLYESAFQDLIASLAAKGKQFKGFETGEQVMDWWLGLFDTNCKNKLDQISIDDMMEDT